MLVWVILIFSGIFFAIALCNVLFWPKVREPEDSYTQVVSVLIAARNEENNLSACLESIFNQKGVVAEILVYDDHSTDRTGQILKEHSAKHSFVKAVPVLPLPAGWCGKNYACTQLARAAKGEWLLFLDADARLASNAINRMLDEARSRQITFLSCWPKIEMHSLAEKILMPLLNFVVFSFYPGPLSLLNHKKLQTDPNLGLAHGACMLFERKSYEEFGGHEIVKDQLFEDTRLAQLWRANGRKGICLDGQRIVSLRMYSSFHEIWFGFQKNFYPAFKRETSFWLFWALHGVVFFCPFVLLLVLKTKILALSVTIVLLTRTFLAIRFGHPLFSVFFHPLGELTLLTLGISSWWKCKVGKGVVWKGRGYQKDI